MSCGSWQQRAVPSLRCAGCAAAVEGLFCFVPVWNTALSLQSSGPRLLLTGHRWHLGLQVWAASFPEKARELLLFIFVFESSKVEAEVLLKYGGTRWVRQCWWLSWLPWQSLATGWDAIPVYVTITEHMPPPLIEPRLSPELWNLPHLFLSVWIAGLSTTECGTSCGTVLGTPGRTFPSWAVSWAVPSTGAVVVSPGQSWHRAQELRGSRGRALLPLCRSLLRLLAHTGSCYKQFTSKCHNVAQGRNKPPSRPSKRAGNSSLPHFTRNAGDRR